MPTETQRKNLEIAKQEYEAFQKDLSQFLDQVKRFESDLEKAGAPWTPGRN
jgi:hypothetical protein